MGLQDGEKVASRWGVPCSQLPQQGGVREEGGRDLKGKGRQVVAQAHKELRRRHKARAVGDGHLQYRQLVM